MQDVNTKNTREELTVFFPYHDGFTRELNRSFCFDPKLVRKRRENG